MIIKLALFITHNIFLTNNQIQELIGENPISCVGVSVPVWVHGKSSRTTEPASEVFCEYEIVYDKNLDQDIEITKKGYKIFLPKSSWKMPKPFPNISDMSVDERLECERKRDQWWKKNPEQMDIKSLEKSKYFRSQIQKLDQSFTKVDGLVDVQHTIEIKTIDSLMNSLT